MCTAQYKIITSTYSMGLIVKIANIQYEANVSIYGIYNNQQEKKRNCEFLNVAYQAGNRNENDNKLCGFCCD